MNIVTLSLVERISINEKRRFSFQKKNMKHWIGLLVCLLAVMPSVGQDNVIDEVVWVVGDEAILKSEVEQVRINA